MHSSSLLFAASSAISFLSVAAQTTPVLEIMWKEETGFIGCFDKAGVSKMSEVEYDKYLITRGTCRDECKKTGAKYSALTEGDTCYCGDVLPDEKYITDYHDCDIPCRTYAGDACTYLETSPLEFTTNPLYQAEERDTTIST